MKRAIGKPVSKIDRVGDAVVVVVAMSVVMMFGLLYTLTPPTVQMVEHQHTMDQR